MNLMIWSGFEQRLSVGGLHAGSFAASLPGQFAFRDPCSRGLPGWKLQTSQDRDQGDGRNAAESRGDAIDIPAQGDQQLCRVLDGVSTLKINLNT